MDKYGKSFWMLILAYLIPLTIISILVQYLYSPFAAYIVGIWFTLGILLIILIGFFVSWLKFNHAFDRKKDGGGDAP